MYTGCNIPSANDIVQAMLEAILMTVYNNNITVINILTALLV